MNGELKETDILYLFILIYLIAFYLGRKKMNSKEKLQALGVLVIVAGVIGKHHFNDNKSYRFTD